MSNRSSGACWRVIILTLLAATFIFGLAIIAIQPPFEGVDETAHFSRLQSQVFSAPAKANTQPKTEDDSDKRITMEVIDYSHHGPMPYQWIDLENLHEKDPIRGYMNYRSFFAQPSRTADYVRMYRQTPLPAAYNAGPEPNWQYQHPALYYVVAGQAMKFLGGHASLVTAFFVLRIFSWMMAFAGFCIGLIGTWNHLAKTGTEDAAGLTALGALFPFLVPEFFWEFARLGNDSLCLGLFGIIWALLLWHIREPRSDAWIYLGFSMGLACVTKAIMIPACGGAVCFLALYQIFVVRKMPGHTRDWWLAPFKIAALAALIGAPCYLTSYLRFGSLGAVEFTRAGNTEHGWAVLQKNFTWSEFQDGLRGIYYSAVWMFGSWSRIIIHIPIHRPIYIFTAIVLISYFVSLRRRKGSLFWLPLWVIVPMFLGLVAHVIVMLVMPANHPTPGYYLHTLAPAFAVMYGAGLSLMLRPLWLRILTICCGAALVLFNFFIAWSYMITFSGCATTPRVENEYLLSWSDIVGCSGKFQSVMTNLKVLAWPGFALACFGATLLLLLLAACLLRKQKVSTA